VKLFDREKGTKSDRGFIEKARDFQQKFESKQKRIGKGRYGRVLKMARKPTNDEFIKTSKITAVGIVLIGGLGFLIYLISSVLAPWIAQQLGIAT